MKDFVRLGAMLPFLLLAACGGRDADPIASKQVGDKDLACGEIEEELIMVQGDVDALIGEKSDSRTENIAWGVAGLFFFPLWLGLDLTQAEEVEMRALEKRARELERIARKKDCDF